MTTPSAFSIVPSTLSLKELHHQSIDSPDYVSTRAAELSSAIASHCAQPDPGVWHSTEVLAAMNSQLKDSKEKAQLPTMASTPSPLTGLFMGVKDLFCTKGLTTTAGSRVLEHYKPPFSATVYEDFVRHGALMSCKTAMDEFAMGSYTQTSFLGRTSIPGLPAYSAGGSSGGSAAALRAGLCDFALGSDTGGSVRQPASHCGVVGFKPSYGGFSRSGMIAYASSLDQAGLFTKTVEDLDYLLSVGVLQKDPKDMTSITLSRPDSVRPLSATKVGYLPHLLDSAGIADSVKNVYLAQLDQYRSLGIEVIGITEKELSLLSYAAQIYYVLACAEASSCMGRYQGIYFGEPIEKFIKEENLLGQDFWSCVSKYRSHYIGAETQKRIMLGSYVLSSEKFESVYLQAVKARVALTQELAQIFKKIDVLALPVSPTPAVAWDKIDTLTSAQTYMADFLTVPFSLARLPALSVPAGVETQPKLELPLPIGIQLVGAYRQDYELVDFARLAEKELGLTA